MFSVVIPAYNCENTIADVLDSVRKQTRVDLIREIIVINDGSSDQTGAVINKYMQDHRELNIIYKEHPNKGVSKTRNQGIRMAKSEWIALLDSDDVWLEHKIEVQYKILRENPQIVFLGAHQPLKFWWKTHQELYKLNAMELCVRSMPTTPSVVFKKEAGLRHGLFDENRKYCEDIAFFQKFLLDDSYYVLPEKLVEISIGKKYFGQSGLSSRLYKMHKGRKQNIRELNQMGLITARYMYFMLAVSEMKFARRFLQQKLQHLLYGTEKQ